MPKSNIPKLLCPVCKAEFTILEQFREVKDHKIVFLCKCDKCGLRKRETFRDLEK